MSRIIGSYVLVSHQSQTCSSHYTEPCITTRTPLDPVVRRGNLLILKYDEDPLVREKYRQSQSWKSWCPAKPQQPRLLRIGTSLLLARRVGRTAKPRQPRLLRIGTSLLLA